MCKIYVWPLSTLATPCRFGGRWRSTVPAGRRGAGQDSLELLEEEPLLQTAGRLQNILAWISQNIPAKPDLWVSYVFAYFCFVCQQDGIEFNNAQNKERLYKNVPSPWVLQVMLLGSVHPADFLTCTSLCYYSVNSSELSFQISTIVYSTHPSNPTSVSEYVRSGGEIGKLDTAARQRQTRQTGKY